MIGFGVIGCGSVAKKGFIPALKKANFARLVAVASRDPEKAGSFSEEFKCDAEKDYESLLKRKDINAVYIATVPSTHEDIIFSAAKYGKHILCEKPLTVSYNSARKIVNYCKEKRVNVFEGFMYQFHSQHKKVRDIVLNGKIGKPIQFNASFGFPPKEENNFRYMAKLGGGSCLDAGSYTIHAARHFYQREPLSIHNISYRDGKEVDIHGAVMLDFGNGQVAQLSFGFNNYYRNTYSIWGTEGHITVKRAFSIPTNMKPKIILEKQDYYEEIICKSDNHFFNEIEYFCRHLGGRPLKKWGEECTAQSKLIDKILNS